MIGAVVFLNTRRPGSTLLPRIGVVLLACFGIVFAGLNLYGRTRLLNGYRNGKYAVVEGRIEHHSFTGKTECFDVRPVKFCRGTAQSAWPGAIVHDGQRVRIAYSDEPKPDPYPVILRIEIDRPRG